MLPFLNRIHINREVIWLKIVYFLTDFGIAIVGPYVSLQMANVGLIPEDISLIMGLTPFIITFTTPLLGTLKIAQCRGLTLVKILLRFLE